MLTLLNVLSPEDVERVRKELAEVTYGDGRKTAHGHAKTVKNNRQAPSEDPRVQALSKFVREAMTRNKVFEVYVRPRRWSKLLFNAYTGGEQYGMHIDKAIMGSDAERLIRTDLSFTLFLSDPESYDGGELVIEGAEGEQAAKLPAGAMVIYPTGRLHRVEPVTRGERLACVGWIQSLIPRGDEREILFDIARVRAALPEGDLRLLLDKSLAQLLRLWGDPG